MNVFATSQFLLRRCTQDFMIGVSNIAIYRAFHYRTDKFVGGVGDSEVAMNDKIRQSRKCRSCDVWCQEASKKNEQKQQQINGTESILLKGCIPAVFEVTTRNYQAD